MYTGEGCCPCCQRAFPVAAQKQLSANMAAKKRAVMLQRPSTGAVSDDHHSLPFDNHACWRDMQLLEGPLRKNRITGGTVPTFLRGVLGVIARRSPPPPPAPPRPPPPSTPSCSFDSILLRDIESGSDDRRTAPWTNRPGPRCQQSLSSP